MPSTEEEYVLFDAGVFIGALLTGDSRHIEARPLVKAARRGDVLACTTTGILSEVYAALTWQQAQPPHDPKQAAEAVRLLVEAAVDDPNSSRWTGCRAPDGGVGCLTSA